MGEWDLYGTYTGLAWGDTFLVRDISATPPSGGTLKQATVGTVLATVFPSGDTSGVTDAATLNAAVSGLPSSGGVIRLSPVGPWYIECGQVTVARSNVILDAPGCVINAVGAGDMINMHDPNLYTTTVQYGGGITGFPWIDGSATTGSSRALNFGDIFRGRVEVSVANFTAGTSIGVWFSNTYTFTEQLSGEIYAQGCSTGVQFDYQPAAGYTAFATGSFARLKMDIYIDSQGLGDGVVITNGVFIYDARLGIYGNFSYPPSGTTVHACLRITGGASATHTSIFDSELWMGCELGGTANAFVPYTICFADNLYNWITDCSGVLNFSAANAFTPCNFPSQVYGFQGNFDGDAGISPLYFGGSSTLGTAVASAPSLASGSAAQLNATQDVMLYANCTAAATFSLSIGPTSAASTAVVASHTAAAGQTYTVRVPASWYVKSTFTSADVTWTMIPC